MSKDELIALIEQAFADTVYPGDDKLINANHCNECEEIAQSFQGKQWQQLTDPDFLRYNHAAISLMYPEGFRFYLPAFMIDGLNDPIDDELIPDSIEYHLTPPKTEGAEAEEWFAKFGQTTMDYFLNRVSGFSPHQKKAIKIYLEDYFQRNPMTFEPSIEQERQRALQFWDTFEG